MQMIQPLCVDQHLQNAVDSTSYCLLNEGVLDPFTSGHINRFLFLILVSRWLVLCVDSHRNLLNVCSTVRLVLFSSQHCLFFSLVRRRKHSVAVWTVRQKKCPHTCWTFSVSVRWHSRPAEFTPVEITQRKAACNTGQGDSSFCPRWRDVTDGVMIWLFAVTFRCAQTREMSTDLSGYIWT